MKVLGYYSAAITIYLILYCLWVYLANTADGMAFFTVVLYAPVTFYVFLKAQQEK